MSEAHMSEETPSSVMLRLVTGAWVTQALHTAAVLGIADRLHVGPATSGELAAATGAHADSLHRLLRYLAALGVLDGDDTDGFRLTPVGELLRTDVPGSERERAIAYGTWIYQAWAELPYSIRSGRPAFDHAFGMRPYEYLAAHPEKARTFDRQMQRGESFFTQVPDAYDFTGGRTIVDVAGGNGSLLAAILTAAPDARGILFDAPHVVEAARDRLRERGVLNRCDLLGGDFFESVPSGGDVYVLSRILHNWDDERCLTLLAACRRGMGPDATLIILERLIPDAEPSATAFASDLNMQVMFGGRERTGAEFRALLAKAGFAVTGLHSLSSDITLQTAITQ
jgi:ubiquinone/menaquinone biosynthesis C-methylase UbiE